MIALLTAFAIKAILFLTSVFPDLHSNTTNTGILV